LFCVYHDRRVRRVLYAGKQNLDLGNLERS